MTVAYRQPPKERITDLVIDSTGLKVFGEGEWKVRKHGSEKRRVWRKLHLAVDPVTHDIVAAEVSLENVHDAEVLPTLLNPLRRKLGQLLLDGLFGKQRRDKLVSIIGFIGETHKSWLETVTNVTGWGGDRGDICGREDTDYS